MYHSVCSQNNQICRNGIIEIGEGGDDSNIFNKDGCNHFCNLSVGSNVIVIFLNYRIVQEHKQLL